MQYGLPPLLVWRKKVEEGRGEGKREEALWAVDCRVEVPSGGC